MEYKKASSDLKMHLNLNTYKYANIKIHLAIA